MLKYWDGESWFCRLFFRSCDSITKLLHNMFNGDVTKNNNFNLNLGCNEVSYCFLDGLEPLLKKLCVNSNDKDAGFTVSLAKQLIHRIRNK